MRENSFRSSPDTVAKAPNPYDLVPYESYPFPRSHIRHLQTIGRLFALTPAALDGCRVLELGGASGGNLIPMAIDHPGSSFLGIDLSPRQIEMGQQQIAELGLKNIELRTVSIMDVDSELRGVRLHHRPWRPLLGAAGGAGEDAGDLPRAPGAPRHRRRQLQYLAGVERLAEPARVDPPPLPAYRRSAAIRAPGAPTARVPAPGRPRGDDALLADAPRRDRADAGAFRLVPAARPSGRGQYGPLSASVYRPGADGGPQLSRRGGPHRHESRRVAGRLRRGMGQAGRQIRGDDPPAAISRHAAEPALPHELALPRERDARP